MSYYSGPSVAESITFLTKRMSGVYAKGKVGVPASTREIDEILEDLRNLYESNKPLIDKSAAYSVACLRIQANLLFAKQEYQVASQFYILAIDILKNIQFGSSGAPSFEKMSQIYSLELCPFLKVCEEKKRMGTQTLDPEMR
jgi:hypothetical protein